MYPYQRTPMGNPYISPIYPYIVGVYGLLSPRIPVFSPYKYHGSTRTLGGPTRPCPLNFVGGLQNKYQINIFKFRSSRIDLLAKLSCRTKKNPHRLWHGGTSYSPFSSYLISWNIFSHSLFHVCFFHFLGPKTEPLLLTRNIEISYINQSKKSPTGPTERTPKKPEYLITRSQLRGPLVRSHSIFDGLIAKNQRFLGLPKVESNIVK